MIDITIVIVNFKYRLDMLTECLDSISMSIGVEKEIIFIDNSPDTAQELLCKKYEQCVYIKNTENVGFARAVNQGMRIAQGRYILLLNGDVVFKNHVLRDMVTSLDQDTDIGIASCIIRYPNGEFQPSIRRFPTPWNQLLILSKLPHIYAPKSIRHYMAEDIDPYQDQIVESIMGAFMWIRRETMDRIGLFDEHFFLWFEEVDYCHRAYKAGIKLKHYAHIEVAHKKGASFATVHTWQKQVWMRQSLRWYMKKHYGFFAWLLFILLQPFFLFTALIAHLFKRY